ncbi:universal stress protein [Pedobacter sp.]|uniref:universal stress protein n=1 Tax=Pedobacter sp. TaxID=1411316 RepID=UPI003D7FB6A7
MKKILAVFDGFKLCQGTLKYAIELTRLQNGHLTGVFLDAFFYRSYNLAKVIKTTPYSELTIQELDKQDEQLRAKSVEEFEKTCHSAGINFSIHRDHSLPLLELHYESMFADMIVINKREKFSHADRQEPTGFIKELLSGIQCPVLVVPDDYQDVKKIVFLYDEEPSSLYAIKMFSYLLENWHHMPIEVLTVNENTKAFTPPDTELMRNFMKRRFTDITYNLLSGEAEETIIEHLKVTGAHQLVVLGAYRRSGFSRWVKRSMADTLMSSLDLPLFIAHH